MMSMQQPQSQFVADFAHDVGHAASPFGLAGSGFGLEPVSERAELAAGSHHSHVAEALLQELFGTDLPSDPSNAKRQRATERRGARSTSRFRGVTHHCRTGRYVPASLRIFAADAPPLAAGPRSWEAHLWYPRATMECLSCILRLTRNRIAGRMLGRCIWYAPACASFTQAVL